MLDQKQFLLLKLVEECTEVGQRACKQMQFGRDEVQKDQELTNSQRLRNEINDLLAVVFMLESIQEIPTNSWQEQQTAYDDKFNKIVKYKRYSQALGKVEL